LQLVIPVIGHVSETGVADADLLDSFDLGVSERDGLVRIAEAVGWEAPFTKSTPWRAR
jgi:hypothetical protein